MAESMQIEVAYATPQEQIILTVQVPSSATVSEAVEASGICARYPEIDLASVKMGIFGKLAKGNAGLHPGDRIELYRPLIADPKEARKKRAAEGKVMKKGAKAVNATGSTDATGDGSEA